MLMVVWKECTQTFTSKEFLCAVMVLLLPSTDEVAGGCAILETFSEFMPKPASTAMGVSTVNSIGVKVGVLRREN